MNALGIDAAWTEVEPSGISLISSDDGHNCKILRLADSYYNFLYKKQSLVNKPKGSKPEIYKLIKDIEVEGYSIDCIAIDMPLSNQLIKGRRSCESEISKAYGAKGAATHSPTIERPGRISFDLVQSAKELGYNLSTTHNQIRNKALIEVYPHTAIIEYLELGYRYEYKISKKNKYKDWKFLSKQERDRKLINNLNNLVEKLSIRINNIKDYLPLLDINANYVGWYLKGYEDIIDSLISSLVGMDYLFDKTKGYGDEDGTIWVPSV
ncbi:DUF429 domain-containing protein [Cellulosilyticum sp. I15G10I2]|uniref:DUF429 domain-containing protein n=1 Tax=Cellulosilyticum sp. I15G10I2 TaxID=1892843 RepID=UPI00085BB21A|nr:DUF429 domain-containing protein [Cellulosilyticum sp. I15G10I2]